MTTTPSDGLARLSELANELFDAQTEVARISAELKAAQGTVKQLEETTIPELMDALGMDEFKTKSGLKVSVTDKLSAKKLTQAHAAALKWLRDNGQAGLIKTMVAVPFTAGHESEADELVEQLAGEGIAAQRAMEVHHSSLAAAIKSMLADGIDVPMELLGGFQRQVATVEAKKR